MAIDTICRQSRRSFEIRVIVTFELEAFSISKAHSLLLRKQTDARTFHSPSP